MHLTDSFVLFTDQRCNELLAVLQVSNFYYLEHSSFTFITRDCRACGPIDTWLIQGYQFMYICKLFLPSVVSAIHILFCFQICLLLNDTPSIIWTTVPMLFRQVVLSIFIFFNDQIAVRSRTHCSKFIVVCSASIQRSSGTCFLFPRTRINPERDRPTITLSSYPLVLLPLESLRGSYFSY